MVMQVVVPSRRIDPIMKVLAHWRDKVLRYSRGLAATRASAEAGHAGFRPAFVKEDEPIGIKAVLAPSPLPPGFDNIVPVLLALARSVLFLYVSPMSTAM